MFIRKSYSFEEVEIHTIYFDDFDSDSYLEELNAQEHHRVNGFLLAKRKREFIATRMLKNELFPNATILYNELGAPYLDDGPFISISHAPGVAGIAFSEKFRIGFDLEPIREKVHRIKSKFLHQDEYVQCDTDDTESLIKIWSGKEALYKLAGRDAVIFAEELILQPISQSIWKGTIAQPSGYEMVEMCIFTENECVISVNTSDVQRS